MSLLGELIPRITSQSENVASDALAYLLRSSMEARQAVGSVLARLGTNPGGDLRFVRESSGDDRARPDFAVLDSFGAEIALIEVKFWAGFTNRQPLAYLARLSEERPTALVFLVPEGRVASAWRHVVGAVRDGGRQVDDRGGESFSFRSGSTGSVSLAVISWRLLLTEIEVALTAIHDADSLSDLRQLKGLVDRMDEDEFIPLQADELSSGVARRHMQLGELLRPLLEMLEMRGVCSRPRNPPPVTRGDSRSVAMLN